MSYIATSDIKSNLATGFQLQDYITECDSEINDLAEQVGIRDSSIIVTTPLHYKIKRYGIVFILMRLCLDKMGSNNVEIDTQEKYVLQFSIYKKELDELKNQITMEMFLGQVNQISDRNVGQGYVFRT